MKRFFVLVTILLLIFFPKVSYAQEQINSFEAKLIPHKDGSISIQEIINYDFGSSQRHGIFRYIPFTSKVGDLYLTSSFELENVLRDQEKEKNTQTKSGDKITVKVGNPDKTITKSHIYQLNYLVKNQIRNYQDHDELYWNVTGDDWPAVINTASAMVELDFDSKITDVKCFTGHKSSTDSNCTGQFNSKVASFKTNSSLFLGEGFTIVVAFPPNTFPKSLYTKDPPGSLTEFQKILILIGAIFYYLILPGMVFYWYMEKKRKNRFGSITVNFDFPQDSRGVRIPPAEVGAIDNSKLEKDDVIATIFDLAIRKFIKIDQQPEKKVLGFIPAGGPDYTLTKLKQFDDLKKTTYEQELWERLFKIGETVKLGDLKLDFYKTFEQMEKSLFSSLIKRGYYTKNPKTQQGLLLVGGILSLISLNLLLGGLLLFLSRKLNGRTQLGDEMDWKVDGLKMFLKNMKRHHSWQANNLITVEKYIPYAIALGFIEQFMEQLKVIYPNYHPHWYTGGNFYHAYPGFYSSMSSSVSTVSPSSSSSGFSSGGSAGGGGGGGGGGSW